MCDPRRAKGSDIAALDEQLGKVRITACPVVLISVRTVLPEGEEFRQDHAHLQVDVHAMEKIRRCNILQTCKSKVVPGPNLGRGCW